MANRFFTLLVIPEKTSPVRRFVIPSWIARGSLVLVFFIGILGIMMLLDYWYVMDQISENKNLKIENRRLRQQTQIYKNRMANIENTMDRIETFSARLKIITNITDRDNLVQRLNQELPDAATNIGYLDQNKETSEAEKKEKEESLTLGKLLSDDPNSDADPESARLRKEQTELEYKFTDLNYNSLLLEQNLQDLYELLIDQRAFLAALPTRKPAVGYFTSGFGIRKSPYGFGEKMHEGLDVANHHGTPIRATANGVVTFAGKKPGYGRIVVIDHGYGLETWYAHARKVLVNKGLKVTRGTKVALMGSTGRSTGPHVHYEVRVHGIPVDPLSYILED